ncbi:sulfate/molybdate ABC transporter ATP-binding protein [Parasphingorhabdus pacifica]
MSASGLRADFHARRGTFRLRGDLDVPRGEVLAVLGPNGSGKSTLLSVLSGLSESASGRVAVGDDVWLDTERRIRVPTHRRGVGLLAQNTLLFPHLSALENVAFGPRSAGAGRSRARELALRWLREVDAADLAERKPGELSGGQAQRIALARALAPSPELLLLDEPLAALDVDAAPAMRGLLHRVLERQEEPAVLVTHDVLDAVVLADRVAVLAEGDIVEQGSAREVLTRPRTPFAARIAGLNLLTGPTTDGGIAVGDITVLGRPAEPVESGEPAAAVFSPGAVAVHREPVHGSPRNVVPVRVTGLEPRGDVVRLRARTSTAGSPFDLAADVTFAAVVELRLATGDDVWFTIKATEVAIHPVSGGSSGM